jgi:hypothetical protein
MYRYVDIVRGRVFSVRGLYRGEYAILKPSGTNLDLTNVGLQVTLSQKIRMLRCNSDNQHCRG